MATTSPASDARGTKGRPGRRWKRTPPPEQTPSTEDWIRLARRVLVEQGIVAVKIDRLARLAGVTRGGFYWRFKSRDDLLDALIEDWRQRNTAPMIAVLAAPGSPRERLEALSALFIEGENFSEAYDSAVRAWAALSPPVAEIARAIDDIRLRAFSRLFEDAGFDTADARIRARIVYFQQVGYYAIGLGETGEDRRANVERYTNAFLAGAPLA